MIELKTQSIHGLTGTTGWFGPFFTILVHLKDLNHIYVFLFMCAKCSHSCDSQLVISKVV